MKREARVKRPARRAIASAFWDASALVPLCCLQPQSQHARQAARIYRQQIVWWGTAIETLGALLRAHRLARLGSREAAQSTAKLLYLRKHWTEVEPSESVRSQAERMIRVHALRTGDALQLAAALVWCDLHPRGRVFVCADDALSSAAEAEGFTVVYV